MVGGVLLNPPHITSGAHVNLVGGRAVLRCLKRFERERFGGAQLAVGYGRGFPCSSSIASVAWPAPPGLARVSRRHRREGLHGGRSGWRPDAFPLAARLGCFAVTAEVLAHVANVARHADARAVRRDVDAGRKRLGREHRRGGHEVPTCMCTHETARSRATAAASAW